MAQVGDGELLPFSGFDGFLGTRGSFMMDIVVLAMFAILPLLAWSVLAARRGQFVLHKRLQVVMGLVLLVAVTAFELDIQYVSKWEERAEPSPFFDGQHAWSCPAGLALMVHLSFAVPTLILWIVVIARALRGFTRPPVPGPHSRVHARWAYPAAIGMAFTSITGWFFYWLAFAA